MENTEEDDGPIEGDGSMTEGKLAEWARAELTRLDAHGIKGDEFERAKLRWQSQFRR